MVAVFTETNSRGGASGNSSMAGFITTQAS